MNFLGRALWSFTGRVIPQVIQRRIVKFVLKQTFGSLFGSDVELDNVDVQLADGHLYLRDLEINVETLNAGLKDGAVNVVAASVGGVRVHIPWNDLAGGKVHVEVTGLQVTAAPAAPEREEDMFKSTYSSPAMSASMYLAESFLDTEEPAEPVAAEPNELNDRDIFLDTQDTEGTADGTPGSDVGGLESLADFIDGIFGRTEVTVSDVSIRLQISEEELQGGLQLHVAEAKVSGEVLERFDPNDQARATLLAKAAKRCLRIHGLELAINSSYDNGGSFDSLIATLPERQAVEIDMHYLRQLRPGPPGHPADFSYDWTAQARVPRVCLRLQPKTLRLLGPLISALSAAASSEAGSLDALARSDEPADGAPTRTLRASFGGLDLFLAFEDDTEWYSRPGFFERAFASVVGRGFRARDHAGASHLHFFLGQIEVVQNGSLEVSLGSFGVQQSLGATAEPGYAALICPLGESPVEAPATVEGMISDLDGAERTLLGMDSSTRGFPVLGTNVSPDLSPLKLVIATSDRKATIELPVLFAHLNMDLISRLSPWKIAIDSLGSTGGSISRDASSDDDDEDDSYSKASLSPSAKPPWNVNLTWPLISAWISQQARVAVGETALRLSVFGASLSKAAADSDVVGSAGRKTCLAAQAVVLSALVKSSSAASDQTKFLHFVGMFADADNQLRLDLVVGEQQATSPKSSHDWSPSTSSSVSGAMLKSWYDFAATAKATGGETPRSDASGVRGLSPADKLESPMVPSSESSLSLRIPKLEVAASFGQLQKLLTDTEGWRAGLQGPNDQQPVSEEVTSRNLLKVDVTLDRLLAQTGHSNGQHSYSVEATTCRMSLNKAESTKLQLDAKDVELRELPWSLETRHGKDMLTSAVAIVSLHSAFFRVFSASERSYAALSGGLSGMTVLLVGESTISSDVAELLPIFRTSPSQTTEPEPAHDIDLDFTITTCVVRYYVGPVRLDLAFRTQELSIAFAKLNGTSSLSLKLQNGQLFLKDNPPDLVAADRPPKPVLARCCLVDDLLRLDHWPQHGFADVLAIDDISAKVVSVAGGGLSIDLYKGALILRTCADSFASLVALGEFLVASTANRTMAPEPLNPDLGQAKWGSSYPDNLLVDLDQSAFLPKRNSKQEQPTPESSSLRDGSGTGLDIIEDFFSAANLRVGPNLGVSEHKSTAKAEDDGFEDLGDRNVFSGAIPRQESLNLVENFYRAASDGDGAAIFNNTPTGDGHPIHRIQVHNFGLFWQLHSGFDWDYVRELGRSESRNVRLRSAAPDVELCISDIRLELQAASHKSLSRAAAALRVGDIKIIDRVPTSVWPLLLAVDEPTAGEHPREVGDSAVRLSFGRCRRNGEPEDLRIRIHMSPLRFRLDQDTIDFLLDYLSFARPYPTHFPLTDVPVDAPFVESFEVYPLSITLDYKPKHVDFTSLTEGNVAEVANLFELKDAKMDLHHVRLSGISGFGRLFAELGKTWLPHILATQVPGVVKGVAPLQPVVNISTGIADLVLLPIEQFHRDGKVVRGLQRGALSFARLAGVELLGAGSALALGTQNLIQKAQVALAPDSIDLRSASRDKKLNPTSQAQRSVAANLREVVNTIVAVPVEIRESINDDGVVQSVVRVAPLAVLRPAGAIAGALSDILLGLRNYSQPR